MSDIRGYEAFLLREYDNIAQAHFNTKNGLIQFFRYYLLIIALPLPLLAVLIGRIPSTPDETALFSLLISSISNIIPFMSLAVTVVGILVMCYISNLHFDALLYARQVNGIRWYFTNNANISKEDLDKIKVLPTNNKAPVFTDDHSIKYMIAVFGIINGAYFYFTFHNYIPAWNIVVFILAIGISIFLHLKLHKLLAEKALKNW